MSHPGAIVQFVMKAIGASVALVVSRLSHQEALVREPELVQQLIAWVAESVSANHFRDINETMRSAVWTAVHHPDRAVLLAERDGQPVGILLGGLEGAAPRQHGFVEWVAVEPDSRCQGIGSTLFDEFATSIGVDQLEGSVNLDDPVASAFWERQGWTSLRPPPRRVMMGGPIIRKQA